MKKILVLAVLILALSASMAGAWVDILTSTSSASTITVTTTATYGVDWLWTYDLVFNPSPGSPVGEQVDSFQLFLGPVVKPGAAVNPTGGWTANMGFSNKLVWDAGIGSALTSSNPNVSFSFNHVMGPVDFQTSSGQGTAFIIASSNLGAATWEGGAHIPTPVPEASTLVGFGSALVMAGPGMIGWLRRRRA